MSEPRRIRDIENHPILRAALDAGVEDSAPDGAEARMLAALGIVTVAKAATAATAVKAGAAATVAKTTKVALFAGVTKWVVASTVVAVVATSGAVAYREAEAPVASVAPEAPSARAPEARPPRAAPSPPVPVPTAAPEPEPEPEPAPAPAPAPAPVVVPTHVASKPVVEPVPSVAASAPSTLSDELAVLADANAAVRRRDADAAKLALDRYDARFPHGALAVEAESLRIESVALRDPARGRVLAASFLKRHPTSPVAPRMKKIAEAP